MQNPQLQPSLHIPTLRFRLGELGSRLGDDPQYTSLRLTAESYSKELWNLTFTIPKDQPAYLAPDDPLAVNIAAFMSLPECAYAMRNLPGYQGFESPTAPPAHSAMPTYPSQTSSYGHPGFNYSRPTAASNNNYNAPTGSGSNTAQGYNNSPRVPQGVPSGATYTHWNGHNGWMAPDMGTFFVVEAASGRLYYCAVGGNDMVWNWVN